MITAVVALRVSTKEQADAFGIDAQRDLVQRFVERERIEVVEWVTDEISGTTPIRLRPGGKRLYEYIDGKRKAEAVIFPRLDRATRDEDAIEIHEVRRDVRNAGMRLAYANTGWSDLSLRGSVVDHVSAVWAAEERRTILERMRGGRISKAQSGRLVCNGRPPYHCDKIGYGKQADLVLNSERAGWIRKAALKIIKGASCESMCAWLQERGVPTPGSLHGLNSRGWWQHTLIVMLHSPTLRGEFSVSGVIIQRDDLRVLTDQQWQALQDAIGRNAVYARRNRRNAYLMAGRIRCSCKRHMAGRPNTGNTLYYVCTSYNHSRRHTTKCGMGHVRGNGPGVDARVWEAICDAFANPAVLVAAIDRHNQRSQASREPLAEELASTERAVAAAGRALASLAASLGNVPERGRAAIEAQIAATSKRMDELEAARDGILARIEAAGKIVDKAAAARVTGEVRLKTEGATFEQQRRVIESLDIVLHMRNRTDGYITIGRLDGISLDI